MLYYSVNLKYLTSTIYYIQVIINNYSFALTFNHVKTLDPQTNIKIVIRTYNMYNMDYLGKHKRQ